MKEIKVVRLQTMKNEDVLVNFNNVSYGTETSKQNTSLRFTHGQGKDCLAVYLIVKENLEEITNKLQTIKTN